MLLLTISDFARQRAPRRLVRYWLNHEDKHYERELERVSRFGCTPPEPMPPLDFAASAILVGIQAALFRSLFAPSQHA
jgi:hypothetical protein